MLERDYAPPMTNSTAESGQRLFPWRFGLFLLLTASMAGFALILPWQKAVMAGFDVAAIGFLLTVPPLIRSDVAAMRRNSARNDANHFLSLVLTVAVTITILVAVATELTGKGRLHAADVGLVIATLLAAWLFSNMTFALHYAHLFYLPNDGGGAKGGEGDRGGVDFPGSKEPLYWDFIYFSFTVGMTFQTSDVSVTSTRWRHVVVLHSFAAFLFNLGVVAFTINSLGA